MSRAPRLALAFALLASLARCTAGSPPPAGQCEFNSDCDSGFVCSGTVCRAPCRTDSDCGNGARCVASVDTGVLACVTITVKNRECSRDSECSAGQACLSGRCRAQCTSDYDCQVVNPASRCTSGACLPVCGAGTADCDGDSSNGCERLDTATNCGACGRACATGQSCRSGACVTVCTAPTVACGSACVDTSSDVANCGACARVCPGVSNGTARCAEGACSFTCSDGFYRDGAGCSAVVAPTIAGPAAGARATTRRPLFRWTLPERGADGARVQICRDRACATVETTFDVTGSSGSPSEALTAGVHFWRLLGRQGTSTGVAPSSATFEISIPARDATRNTTWGAYPDLNADGFADALVGEPGSSQAHVYYGSATGLPSSPSLTLTNGDSAEFGKSVSIAGDIDGDGFVDAVVSSPDQSSITIFYGSATGIARTGSTIAREDFQWGYQVAAAGDVDNDGHADLAVWNGPETNSVDIVYGGARGSTLRVVRVENLRARGSTPLAGVGKVNGDEFDDLAVAAYEGEGTAVWVFFGSATGLTLTPGAIVHVETLDAVAAAGDVNGDGTADVLTGGYGGLGARLFLGSNTGLSEPPALSYIDTTVSDFGATVSGVGDVNGDGFGDVAVGDAQSRARLYFGAATPSSSSSTLLTGSIGTFSTSLTFAGDIDRDGFDDVLVGSPSFGGKGPCDSAVYLFRGWREGAAPTPITIDMPDLKSCGTLFGFSVASNLLWPLARFVG